MKQLHIITVQPDDGHFWWQTLVQLSHSRELGISDKFRVLVFIPPDEKIMYEGKLIENKRESIGGNPKWKELEKMFPETKFFYYFDKANIMRDIGLAIYIPLLRPYLLAQHFAEFKELKDDAIFYIDGDVLFTKPLDWITEFLEDDVNYLSDTKSYLNSDYFDSKIKDVRPKKLEEYKKIDVLGMLAKAFGISRELCVENKDTGTGGAQSLLKNVDSSFWQDVYQGSIFIRMFLMKINQEYFPSENAGFQSWCADMWSLLFNLWRRGRKTSTPVEFDFAWASDRIEKLERVNMFHNAGIVSPTIAWDEDGKHFECPALFKSKQEYVNNTITPFEDTEVLNSVDENPLSEKWCTHFYNAAILDAKQKHNL